MKFSLPVYDSDGDLVDRTTVELNHSQIQSILNALVDWDELKFDEALRQVGQDCNVLNTPES